MTAAGGRLSDLGFRVVLQVRVAPKNTEQCMFLSLWMNWVIWVAVYLRLSP